MNDPIRSVGMVRQGVERGRGTDAAAQHRFLAMLAAVRPIETGPEGPARPHSPRAAHDTGTEARGDRDIRQFAPVSRVADADPSFALAQDPVFRVRGAMAATTTPRSAMTLSGAIAEGSAPQAVSNSARPGAAAGPIRAQTAQDERRVSSASSSREAASGRSELSAHRIAAPVQPAALGMAPHTAATPASAPHPTGHAVQQMNVASAPLATATPAGQSHAAAGSPPVVHPSGAQDAGLRHGDVVTARTEVAMAAMLSAADARTYLDAPADAARAQTEAPPIVLNPDVRQIRHSRATERSADAAPGRGGEPTDSELGAMLRHLMGVGGVQRAQRMADGSWATRIAIPGEGAVSIRIARSPEQISVRLSGDPELVRRVRETLEAGGARHGRRLSIRDTAEA